MKSAVVTGALNPARPGSEAVIECRELRKDFHVLDGGDVWRVFLGRQRGTRFAALNGVTLSVPKSEFLGLLGCNGAGKSTLLRTIGGVYAPTAGVVIVNGPLSVIYELGAGGSDVMTGRAFARRWLGLLGGALASQDQALEEIRAFSELDRYFDMPLYSYSSGMKARLYFSVATEIPAAIYLIDEVLVVGDEHFQAKCWRRLRERLDEGCSGILASHDWSAILKLCREACVIDRGQIVDQGPAAAVVRRYLDLPMPQSDVARFAVSGGAQYSASPGCEARFVFPVEVLRPVEELCFGLSIEQFRRGSGWEVLVHLPPREIDGAVGEWTVTVSIPEFPLAGGAYSLNVFFARRVTGTAHAFDTLDVRSWVYGNDLRLAVAGPTADCAAVVPMRWKSLQDGQ